MDIYVNTSFHLFPLPEIPLSPLTESLKKYTPDSVFVQDLPKFIKVENYY